MSLYNKAQLAWFGEFDTNENAHFSMRNKSKKRNLYCFDAEMKNSKAEERLGIWNRIEYATELGPAIRKSKII